MRRFPTYPKYKDSGVEWLGEVPEGWNVQKVKRVVLNHKQGYYSENPYLDSGVKLIRISDIDLNGNVDYSCMPFVEISPSDENQFGVINGDFLFARTGSVGYFGLIKNPERAVFASYLIRFRFKRINFDFLKFIFSSSSFKEGLHFTLHGGVNQNIHAENIKDQYIAYPPLPEQTAIAAFLDRETARIDTLIEKKERLIALLEEKRAALISQAVTKGLDPTVPMKDSGVEWIGMVPERWKISKTKYVASLHSGHTPSRQHPEYWENCVIPWFSLADVHQIRDGRKDYLEMTSEKISILGLDNSAAELLPKGTVVLSRTASVGFSGIMNTSMATTQDFANWVCSDEILPEYLLYVFRSMQNEFSRLIQGSTHKTIYMPDIEKFKTPIPPLSEQANIIAYLLFNKIKIEKIEDLLKLSIKNLNEYRSALISAAVTGKIDVRGRLDYHDTGNFPLPNPQMRDPA